MPDTATPELSEAGKLAMKTLMDTRFEREIRLRDEVITAIGAFFRVPVNPEGGLVNSLAPISRRPQLAVETIVAAREGLEALFKESDREEIVVTRFGAMRGEYQEKARARVLELVKLLEEELKTAYLRRQEVTRS